MVNTSLTGACTGLQRTRRRGAALSSALVLAALAAACSAAPRAGSSSTTTLAPGVAVLGASYALWVRGHPAVTVDGATGYGTAVRQGGRSVPEFTDVRRQGGKVVALHMALPGGSDLARAEQLVRAQLPTDARQTASWRGSFRQAADHCEYVNFQSATLATSLGTAAPAGSTANIGTSLYERSVSQVGSPSIATVDAADIGTTPAVLLQPCSP